MGKNTILGCEKVVQEVEVYTNIRYIQSARDAKEIQNDVISMRITERRANEGQTERDEDRENGNEIKTERRK